VPPPAGPAPAGPPPLAAASRRPPLRDQIAVCVAGWLVAGISLGVILYSTGGQIAAPLDDTYIHLQYARQLAAGHFFAYNTADGYSSGATSFLYVLLLGLAARLGAQGDGLLWVAQLFNAGLFGLSAWLSYRLGWALRNRLVGLLAAGLFVLTAHLVWGFATGMETGLVCTLVLGSLYLLGVGGWGLGVGKDGVGGLAAAAGRWSGVGLVVVLVGLAWVRPEGLALVWMAAAVGAWRVRATRGAGWRVLGRVVIAAGVGLLPLLLNWALTGRPTPNAALAKSELYQQPQFELLDFLRNWIGIYSSYFAGVYAAAGSTVTFMPFALLFVMLGGLPAAWREIGRRRPGLFTLAMTWFFGGMLISALLQPTLRGRYQMPYYGIFVFLTAVGLYDVARALAGRPGTPGRRRQVRATVAGIAGLGAIVLFGNVIMLWTALGENTLDIYNQHVQMGRWIDRNLPSDARVAMNDVGAMTYYGHRYVYDLIGLTTNATAGLHLQGDGAVYDWLRQLPVDRRPDYFVVHRGWLPELVALPGFLTPIYTRVLPHPTIVEGTLSVYVPNWDVVAGSDVPVLPHDADPVALPATGRPFAGSRSGPLYLGQLRADRETAIQLRVPDLAGAALPRFDLIEDDAQLVTPLGPDGDGVYRTTLRPGSYRLYVAGPGGQPGHVDIHGAVLWMPGTTAPLARQEVDRLNVGWPPDEAAHAYVVHSAQWNVYAPAILRQAPLPGAPGRLLTDSGRNITGDQEFTIATHPGQPLRIVDRHLAEVPQRVQVAVDGVDVGTWFWPAAPGWDETTFLVPAAAIRGSHTRLRLTLQPDGSFTPLRAFYYWFYQ